MVKKKQKVYLSLGIIFLQTTLMADGLASILVSQKTKDSVIENKNFDGESLYSFLWGSTDFLSSSLGSYITIGGTVDFRSDEDKKRDEKSGDFDNYLSYNVYNTGLTYTPTNNLTLLGGVGYGQSKGRYYQKNTTSNNYSELVTEKEKGVNFNLAVNYYYKSIGLVAMYDTFPKVFSVGISYNFTTDSVKRQKKKTSPVSRKSSKPSSLDYFGAYLFGAFAKAYAEAPSIPIEEDSFLTREDKDLATEDRAKSQTIIKKEKIGKFSGGVKSITKDGFATGDSQIYKIRCNGGGEERVYKFKNRYEESWRRIGVLRLGNGITYKDTIEKVAEKCCKY